MFGYRECVQSILSRRERSAVVRLFKLSRCYEVIGVRPTILLFCGGFDSRYTARLDSDGAQYDEQCLFYWDRLSGQ